MNRRLRVLLIGRYFWPHGSVDSAGYLFQLATGLDRRGVHVEVLSPRYASSWPDQLTLREIAVHRPAAAPRSEWSISRYLRHLTGWLREHAAAFDILFVDGIREESIAAVEVAREGECKTLLRLGGWGGKSDADWWQTSRSARRCAAFGKTADGVIAKSAACGRALLAEGFAAANIHRIGNGFATGASPTKAIRATARKRLAAVNSDLMTADDTPVLVCAGRMTRGSGMNLLVKSAPQLVSKYPDLRLWLIGDGPQRESMYDSLRSDGLRASIAMPGTFVEMDDVMTAADIYVQCDDQGLDYFLPTAVSYELPIVAIDNEPNRTSVIPGIASNGDTAAERSVEKQPQTQIKWFPEANSKSLRTAIFTVLEDLPEYRSRAAELRRLMLRVRPQNESFDTYIELMQRMKASRSGSANEPSIEAAS